MALNIKILGPGCPNCHRVKQSTMEALEILSEEDPALQATVQHVTGINEIMDYQVLVTPGLVVNGAVVCAGRIPAVEEVVNWLRAALDGEVE